MNGSAKAGLILSIVGIILSIAVYAFYLISLFTSGQIQDMMDTYEYYYDFGEDDFEIKILNTGEMVHNMEQFVRAAGRKSWNFKRNRCGMRRSL